MNFIHFGLFLLFIGTGSFTSADTECPNVSSTSHTYNNPTIFRNSEANNIAPIRIVQYNVEWLFVDEYSAANCPGSGCSWKNQTEAETHLKHVANVISGLKPDIINLCEVEGCDELNMVIQQLPDNGFRPYLKKGCDTSTGQNAGMISRIAPVVNLYRTEERVAYPIPGSKCGYNGAPGTSGVTKHYITEFDINNVKIAFIGAHLLAYPTDLTRCAEREAQAQVLQNVIADYFIKDYEVIVMGDFNDFDGKVVDANNNMPISQVLDILKGYAGTYANRYELFSVAETIPKNERFSDWWDQNGNCVSTPNEFSTIDHMLVSKALQQGIVNSFFYHGYDEFCETYESDHYPLVIDIII
jgi:endonuclease/exonuclease/phosphatase family metal-dependent hydrolase